MVKYLRITGKNNLLSASLVSYCKTRWNTVVLMFAAFLKVYNEIRVLLNEENITRFNRINAEQLTEITKFLELFKNVSVELESDKQVTSVKILPAFEMIIDHITIKPNDSPTIRKMKIRAAAYIDEHKSEVLPDKYELWPFFHPNFKKLQGFKTVDKFTVMQNIEFLVGLNNETSNNVHVSVSVPSDRESVSQSNTSIRSPKKSVFNSLQDNVDVDTENHSTAAEIDRYVNTKHATVTNLLEWWTQNREVYPQLYRYFMLFAAIPATSASAERIFSDAGNIITNKRSRLTTKNVNQLAFLHRNHKRMN